MRCPHLVYYNVFAGLTFNIFTCFHTALNEKEGYVQFSGCVITERTLPYFLYIYIVQATGLRWKICKTASMASHIKPGSLETTNGYSQDEWSQSRPEASGGGFSVAELLLRVLALAATLCAAVVMSKAKQTELVPVIVSNVRLMVPVPAKYHYSPAFIYFVVANSVACGYTALSILASFSKRKKSSVLSTFLLAITDLVMVALISSAASAATAYAYIGLKGNSHTGWNKICNVYDKFCRYVGAALGVSFVGMNVFLILTVMQLYSLYKRSRARR